MYDESIRHDKLDSIPLEYLRKITNNFSNERLVGEGSFGKVYKGILQNGEVIAVKKLASSMPGVNDKQFENEAHHLMRLGHPNIVLLVGCCSETENTYVEHNGKYICAEKRERLLCLEYMPNGSLRGYLSDESSGLDWHTRYNIIMGICFGLHYIHEECHAPIIHMDLKPANILLDNNMVPKIADFGLSRLFSEEKTWTCTTSRDGTLGYMAPEYINRGLISKKSDIFSLGVIIIQIIVGHKDYPEENRTASKKFIELVLKNWRNRLEKTSGYTSLEIDCQQVRRCLQIGLACVKLDRAKRPTISQIIKKFLTSEDTKCSKRKRGTITGSREEPARSGGQAMSKMMWMEPKDGQATNEDKMLEQAPALMDLRHLGKAMITVFINGVLMEVPRAPIDLRAMFGPDVMLVHSSGGLLPVNDNGILTQSLKMGECYYLVSK